MVLSRGEAHRGLDWPPLVRPTKDEIYPEASEGTRCGGSELMAVQLSASGPSHCI
jgi:hypothetical protein